MNKYIAFFGMVLYSNVLGGKWTLPVINSICNSNKRFRDIERNIPGIITRMLSKELKEMTANQLIKRTVIDDTRVSPQSRQKLIKIVNTNFPNQFITVN